MVIPDWVKTQLSDDELKDIKSIFECGDRPNINAEYLIYFHHNKFALSVNYSYKRYHTFGRSRLDGPTIFYTDGREIWYIHGVRWDT